jgi:hypothetical protein
MVLYGLLASTSSSAAVTALDARKRDSLLSVQTKNGAGPGATLATSTLHLFKWFLTRQWEHQPEQVTRVVVAIPGMPDQKQRDLFKGDASELWRLVRRLGSF